MLRRPRIWPIAFAASLPVLPIPPALAGDGDRPPDRAAPSESPRLTPLEDAVLRALASNPATAPYVFATAIRERKLVLMGRVGTKEAHDVAVRSALAFTPSVDDRLVIDTAETWRAVAASTPAGLPPGADTARRAASATAMPGVPYLYPPPIFNYVDEPFYGFEPPVISYPPWWGAMSARRLSEYAAARAADAAAARPPAAPPDPVPAPEPESANPNLPVDTVEMKLDPQGVAVLRGKVSSQEERAAVERQISETPGVTQVVNQIEVVGPSAAGPEDVPPPPPVPDGQPARPDDRPPGVDPAADPRGGLSARVEQAVARRPALENLAIDVTDLDGVVTLAGQVPSVYEAMLAHRAAEQTPGVRGVVDRLTFAVPDGRNPNPLLEKGRPEDIEPYLKDQIQRQVGDSAHVDRISLRGDDLEVRGTLASDLERARIEAILRSMPILRGFRLRPELRAD